MQEDIIGNLIEKAKAEIDNQQERLMRSYGDYIKEKARLESLTIFIRELEKSLE